MKKYTLTVSLILNLIFIVLAVRHFIISPSKNTPSSASYFVHRNTVYEQLPKSNNDIIFCDDSEIAGFPIAELFKNTNIKNRGIYYDTSNGLLHRANDISVGKPAKVFIEIGINDLQTGIAIDTTAKNGADFINIIKKSKPTTEVYLQGVLPVGMFAQNSSIESRRIRLNSLYKQISIAKAVHYIDLDAPFAGYVSNYDAGDHVHLNGNGYIKWKEVLEPYL